ncbi:MAG: hypothetical protein JWP49_1003 [Phenylobacterium sp.]|jgi:hypothetical protein|nr:hypothetical protein [Phenylobacterium sp.]
MTHHLKAGLAGLAVALSLSLAGGAQAAPQRVPDTGTPAVVMDVPDGWILQRLSAITLNVFNPLRTAVISITLETTPANPDLNLFRDNLFRAAECSSLNRAESLRIGGRPAQVFYCQPKQTALAPARVALVKLGDTHVLAVSTTYRLDATGADIQGLEKVIATSRYEDAPK